MSALERVSGRDWAAWVRHVVYSAVQGAALAVKSAGGLCVGATLGTDQWSPTLINLEMLGWAALAGFLYAFCDAVAKPPTGNEVDE